MRPTQSIKTCLAKSLSIQGRASRAEFWWFAPLGLVPFLIVANQIAWDQFEMFGIWRVGLLMLVALPLLSAGWRRIQETGEDGQQILLPFLPPILLWIAYQAILWFSVGTAFLGMPPVLGFFAILILVPAYCFALLASFTLLGPVIGLLIVPSDPNSNRYGPNPYEVSP